MVICMHAKYVQYSQWLRKGKTKSVQAQTSYEDGKASALRTGRL